MRYMLLIYNDPAEMAAMTEEEGGRVMADYFAFTRSIAESGELLAGDPLQDETTATTVRTAGGTVALTDGPFAETKEVLGGYYIVDCADIDHALALAARIPMGTGCVEVRPIQELGEMPG